MVDSLRLRLKIEFQRRPFRVKTMPRTYFEPENLDALVEVFREAQRILQRRGVTDPQQLDLVARRIMDLAYQQMPPWLILGEIMPPPLLRMLGSQKHQRPLKSELL